jgi:hypothetical protein
VVKKRRFPLNPMEKDLSTARNVIENAGPREGFNIDKERGFSKDL